MEQTNPPNPAGIMQMATGYWASATLFAACELDLFERLAEGPQTAAAFAGRYDLDPRGMVMLLDACAGLGLLIKRETTDGAAAHYQNSEAAGAFLVPGKPGFLGSALRWSADQYTAWGQLAASVKTGQPAVPPALHLGADPAQTRNFVLGMHQRALGIARGVLPFLELMGVRRLLDVGGGPGTYAVLLAQREPDLQVDVLDLPGVVAIAQELIAEASMSERVRTRPGNGVTDDYGAEQYDAVLFSGVLHQMQPETICSMFQRAFCALIPGGRVLISDMMLAPDKTQPVFSTLFSLQMLLTSDEGAVFSAEECLAWLSQAGFTDTNARPLPPPLPYTVITAIRT